MTYNFPVTRTTNPKPRPADETKLGFAKYFTDHMFIMDYDEGQVMVAPDRRVGLISQIPVYPDGYTVEDVLRSAFERMFRMKEEMDRLTEQMAAGDSSSQTLKRYGELTARFEGLGGYDTDTAVNKVANGLSIDTEMRQRLFDQLSGGEKLSLIHI